LRLPGVEFFLDTDAVWTMEELIEADILIMAKGYFSYYAGLICDGIKIFEPMPGDGQFGGNLPEAAKHQTRASCRRHLSKRSMARLVVSQEIVLSLRRPNSMPVFVDQ
jgi:hypothetical protein